MAHVMQNERTGAASSRHARYGLNLTLRDIVVFVSAHAYDCENCCLSVRRQEFSVTGSSMQGKGVAKF
jgi:hypothetical protein